jgi:ribosomal protein S7
MPFPIDKSFNKKNLTKIKQKIIKKKYKNIYSTSNILSNKISNSNSFPLKRKTLYQSLVCKITKSGNKTLGKKLLNLALVKAALFTKLNPSFILSIIFNSLLVSIEVKDVRRRGKLYKIPFPISLRRKKYLTEK